MFGIVFSGYGGELDKTDTFFRKFNNSILSEKNLRQCQISYY